jgi:RNA polymerase sigma-70 factor (family 1)
MSSIDNQKEIEDFKKIFDHYYDGLRNFVYYKTGDSDLAEDIVQEVFMKVWSIRSQVVPETVKSFLYTIAENITKNYYRHQQVVYNFATRYEGESMTEEADHEIRREEFHLHLQKTLSEIPEKSRIVFLMNRIDGFTYAEIAERLNLSVKAIEKRMSEAIAIIREKIKYKI